MRQSASYALVKCGGPEAATALATEWCRRMSWFFDMWMERDQRRYEFTADELGGCPVDEDWVRFRSTLRPGSYAAECAVIVENIRPAIP